MDECVSHCPCNQQVIKIQDGRYNYPELILYTQGDLKAWNLFKSIRNKF